jgi:hypothetical protein
VKLADWQINKVARYIGTVQAPAAEAAIRREIEKFGLPPEHRDRIAARQIVFESASEPQS